MQAVNAFKAEVKNVVAQAGLHVRNWKSGGFRALSYQANAEILKDAFSKHDLLKTIFAPLSLIFERSCKLEARLTAKRNEVEARGGEHFRVVSDFVAARVPCRLQEMTSKIDCIRQIVMQHNGTVYVRGESEEQPYGFFKKGASFSDIVQFVYVYLEEIGYPIEFQVGHPFAFHTFTVDSRLRDDSQCGLTDLWKDGFYTAVRDYIIRPSPKAFTAIEQKAKDLHNGVIPQELHKILINIFLENCTSYGEFREFIYSHPDIDVDFHKNELIDCFARGANPREYYVYNARVVYDSVKKEIESERFLAKLFPIETRENEYKFLAFCKKLIAHIPPDQVDYSPSKEVFLRACEHGIHLEMTCEQAIEFACQVGVELTKINLSLFKGKVSEDSLKKLVATCPNIRSFILDSVLIDSPTRGFDEVIEILKIPSLEEFVVSGRLISDAGYEAMSRLKMVDVYDASLQDLAAAILAKSTTLETVKIHGRAWGYGGYKGCISDKALEDFKNCLSLKHLDISGQTVTKEAVQMLQQARPELTIIHK